MSIEPLTIEKLNEAARIIRSDSMPQHTIFAMNPTTLNSLYRHPKFEMKREFKIESNLEWSPRFNLIGIDFGREMSTQTCIANIPKPKEPYPVLLRTKHGTVYQVDEWTVKEVLND